MEIVKYWNLQHLNLGPVAYSKLFVSRVQIALVPTFALLFLFRHFRLIRVCVVDYKV